MRIKPALIFYSSHDAKPPDALLARLEELFNCLPAWLFTGSPNPWMI
jgi:hypothetical protein